MAEKELTPLEALDVLTARTNNAVAINFARMMGKAEWLRASKVITKALEENAELKEQLRLKEVIHTTFFENNGELVENIEIDSSDVFGEDIKKIDRIVVNVADRNVNKYINIEDVKKIVENEKCKVCDSKWYKGCRCARNKIITELDKLKGE